MDDQHPIQPVLLVDGIARFKENAIVRFLLDNGPYDLNSIAAMEFSQEDHEQLAQLIGYSVGGFCDLGYASERVKDQADAMREQLMGIEPSGIEAEPEAPAPSDGGPAFPHLHSSCQVKGESEYEPGMSLRDYYAGQFAAAWVIALSRRTSEEGYSDYSVIQEANRLGMLQADAMLGKEPTP